MGAIEACEAAGIKEADVDFGCAVAVVNAVAASDGAVEVAGGEQEEAAGFEETGEERDGGGGVGQMLNDLDHADHIVGRGRLAGDFVEVEDAEAVGGFQECGVGTDVVAGELERAAGEGAAFAEKFEEAAGAATEVEPVQGSGGGGRRREGERGRGGDGEVGFGEAGEVGEFEGAVGAAVVAVFCFVVDKGVGALAAVVGVVVDFETGKRFDEEQFAIAAGVKGELLADKLAGFFSAERELGGAAGAARGGGGGHPRWAVPPLTRRATGGRRRAIQRERSRRTAPVAQRARLRGQFLGT